MDLRPFGYEPRPALRPKTLKATPSPASGCRGRKGPPGRSPISVEGMPRCINSTLTGISGRRARYCGCVRRKIRRRLREWGHWEPSLSQIGVHLEAGSEQIEAIISCRSLPRVRSHRCGGNAADHEFGPGGNTAIGTRTAQHVDACTSTHSDDLAIGSGATPS